MRFEEVGTFNDKLFDMVVETSGDYKAANPSENGFECGQPSAGCINGRFAQVSVAVNSSVDLKISFQDSVSHAPVTLNKFLMSFHDVDQVSSKLQEKIYIAGFAGAPITALGSEVTVSTEADGRTLLTSTKDGTSCDDPKNPMNLGIVTCSGQSVNQKKRAAAFVFENTAEISVTFQVTCDNCGQTNTGRSFLFTGDTNLVTCAGRR